ncbi:MULTISPECIES: hypothetical protein [Photobacterium]|uniref:hypothetical protein n=1 Tax=Photobacterium TaxID=657 RepID=UPI000D18159B|nr:hypothetical protein [Photobacterium phosphoreum]PSU36561.1 hypothetical protein CTM85_16855 [Photobacterium phosphoreum]
MENSNHDVPLLITDMDTELSVQIIDLWDSVVRVCNKTLHHADIYGFNLMHIPDPSISKIIQGIELQIYPILEALINKGYLNIEDEMALFNVKIYLEYLSSVVNALKTGNVENFDIAVKKLSNQAMILVR